MKFIRINNYFININNIKLIETTNIYIKSEGIHEELTEIWMMDGSSYSTSEDISSIMDKLGGSV